MACKLEEAVQEINKLLALPAVNKEKIIADKLNLAKQSIEAQMKLLGAQVKPDTVSTNRLLDKLPKIIKGNIWEQKGYKVITTNLGGVHGAGLAKQAKLRGKIEQYKNKSIDTRPRDSDVITLAVKGMAPETVDEKYKGYKNNSWAEKVENGNIDLLKSEIEKLKDLADTLKEMVYLPLAGLGHGEGNYEIIMPILEEAARHPRITLITPDETARTSIETTRGTARTDNTYIEPVKVIKQKEEVKELIKENVVDVPVQYRENTKEQLKQEQDIILPSEAFENNVKNTTECKE